MNKHLFIEELSRQTNLDIDTCSKINDILEHNFFISKKSKPVIITAIVTEIGVDEEKAEEIYNTAISVMNKAIKDKILHPFKTYE